MINGAKLRKLSLNRETLLPLQSSDLEDVNGGTGALCRTAVKVSQRWCSVIVQSTVEIVTRAVGCNGGGGNNGGQPQQ